MNPNKIKKALI